MKRSTAFVAGILCLSLSACGSSGSAQSPAENPEGVPEEASEASGNQSAGKAEYEFGEPIVDMHFSEMIYGYSGYALCPVINTGTSNMYIQQGQIDLEDSDGKIFDSVTVYDVFPNVIAPGETAYVYYYFYYENDPGELKAVPHITAQATSENPAKYEFSDVSIKSGENSQFRIVGRVENTSSQDAQQVRIGFLLYDANNNIIGVNLGSTTVDDLAAGQKKGFACDFYSEEYSAGDVDHYEILSIPYIRIR